MTLWKRSRPTRYELLVWRDSGGICWKVGGSYGYGCWETTLPCRTVLTEDGHIDELSSGASYFTIPFFKKKK